MRSPATLGSVTAAVIPGVSAGKPFAVENPVKIGLFGLSLRTKFMKLLSVRLVWIATSPEAMPNASIWPERSSRTSGSGRLVGVVLGHDVVDEMGLDGDRDEVLHHAGELVGDGEAWILPRAICAGDDPYSVSGRRSALSSMAPYRAWTASRFDLDRLRVDRPRWIDVEARLDSAAPVSISSFE